MYIDTIKETEKAIRSMSANEMHNILKMTGYLEVKDNRPGVIFQVNPRFTTEVLRELRFQGITCLCEQYKRNGKITILNEDINQAKKILEDINIDYSIA